MHGDYITDDGRRIRDTIFDMAEIVGMRRAIAIALEHVRFGHGDANTLDRIEKELRSSGVKSKDAP